MSFWIEVYYNGECFPLKQGQRRREFSTMADAEREARRRDAVAERKGVYMRHEAHEDRGRVDGATEERGATGEGKDQ